MIKLIVADLDDTLLNPDARLSAENKRVIGEALKRGVSFTIATGRMFQAAAPFARQLGLSPEQPLICYSGALIKRLSGEVLYTRSLPTELAAAVADYGQSRGWTVNLYYNDELYVGSWNRQVEQYLELVQVDAKIVGDLAAFIRRGNKELSKILIINDPRETVERIEEIRSFVGPQVQIARSRPKLIEITNSSAHKGKALLWLAEFMGLAAAEILAIGDSNNDQTMLEAAGIGIAMGNAPPEIKKAADFKTGTNYEDGVAQAILKHVFGRHPRP